MTGLQYLVQWEDYPKEKGRTWETETAIDRKHTKYGNGLDNKK